MLKHSPDDGSRARRIRLAIADRQPIVLQGLISIFATQSDFEIVASCSDGTSLLKSIQTLAPDIVLLSDSLPRLTAFEILAVTKANNLSTRIVLFTEHEHDHDLTSAVAAGDCASISKLATPDALLRLLRMMMKSITPAGQLQHPSLPAQEADTARLEKMLELLTQREREIVGLVSDGLSNKEIARQLNLSHGTVKVHLHNIFQKLAVNNRTMLATIALLQRSAGFGTLLLAAFAFAVLDDAEASSKNAALGNDDGTARDDDAGLEPFELKLTTTIVRQSSGIGEKVLESLGDQAREASEGASVAARADSLEAVRQSVVSAGRSDAPIGSSTPPLAHSAPLRAIGSQIGGPIVPQQSPLISFGSNLTQGQGGYGLFTALTGAWIFALESSHAVAQPLGSGEVPVDAAMVLTRESSTNASTTAVHREFTSWTDTINLAAFGTLAFLQLTSVKQSVPPHTLAWIYNPATNETIVYVNPTDRSLEVGDAELLEFHVQGFISVADLGAFGPEATAAATTSKSAEAVGIAGEDPPLAANADDPCVQVKTSESVSEAASGWTIPTQIGLRFCFDAERIGSSVSSRRVSSRDDLATAKGESDGRLSSFSVSSIPLTLTQTPRSYDEDHASKKEAINPNGGGSSSESGKQASASGSQSSGFAVIGVPAEAEKPIAATGNGAGHANSQHASKAASETVGGAEPTDDSAAAPGKSPGHSNSQEASQTEPETAAAGGPSEPGAAPGNSADHGNSQLAAKAASETVAGAGSTDDSAAPAKSLGNSNPQQVSQKVTKTVAASDPTDAGVTSQRPDSNSAASSASTALIETSIDQIDSAGQGTSERGSQSAAQKTSPHKGSAAATFEPELVFRFDSLTTPSLADADLRPASEAPSFHAPVIELTTIIEVGPSASQEQTVGHDKIALHHATVPLPHDILI